MTTAALEASPTARIVDLGRTRYEPVWHDMRAFTDSRGADDIDEIWFTEHEPVFTLGVNAATQHVLAPGSIPLVRSDRGGQVTYHGPGQLMIYPLIDLRRARLGVRDLVTALEQSVVDLATNLGLEASSRPEAPGVYVGDAKLASVGLRVRRGCSLHGMALNVDMDIEPFSRINPCGFAGLEVTDLSRLGAPLALADARARLTPHLLRHLRLTLD